MKKSMKGAHIFTYCANKPLVQKFVSESLQPVMWQALTIVHLFSFAELRYGLHAME
jgi:hypothetical protein